MSGEIYKVFAGSLPHDITQEEVAAVFNTYGTTTDIHVMTGKSTSGQSCAFVVYDRYEAAESAIATLDNVYSIREGETPIRVSWARPSGPQRTTAPAPMPAQTMPVRQTGGAYAMAGAGMGAASMGAYNKTPIRHSGGAPPPPPAPLNSSTKGTKLFVGNLPADVSQDAICYVFGSYGTVVNVHIMAGRSKSGQSCAFVEYSTPFEAETAILTLHDRYEIRAGEGPIMVKYASSAGPGPMVRRGPY